MSDVSVSLGVSGKDTVIGAFADVSKAGEAMGKALMDQTKKLAAMFLGFEAVKKGAEQFFKALEEGGRLSDLSEQTGIAVQQLVLLERAFENNGLQAEDVGGMINRMQKALAEGGEAGSQAADKLHQLGLEVSSLQAMTPDQQFEAFGNAIRSIEDPAERTRMAMEIFGKSGGRMLALFANMSEEIRAAKDEVGSYADVMGDKAQEFDKLGDKLQNAIGHKVIEFFAGALSNLSGGLSGLAESVAKFDAASLGQKITQGLSEPMMALATAITTGQFKEALNLAYEMVKLQAMKMGNEIYKEITSAVAALETFFSDVFGANSKTLLVIQQSFRSVGLYISKEILSALADVVSVIPGIGKQISEGLMEKSQLAASKLENSMRIVANASGAAGDELERAGSHAASIAVSMYKTGNGLFDTNAQMEKLAELSQKVSTHWEMTDRAADSFLSKLQNPTGFPNVLGQNPAEESKPWDQYKKPWQKKEYGPLDDGKSRSSGGGGGSVHDGASYGPSSSMGRDGLSDLAAMRNAIENMGYYSHGNESMKSDWKQESYTDAVKSLSSKLRDDFSEKGKLSKDYEDQAKKMLEEQMNKEKNRGGGGSGKGPEGKGPGSKGPGNDPMEKVLQSILKVVEDINKTKLPVMALS